MPGNSFASIYICILRFVCFAFVCFPDLISATSSFKPLHDSQYTTQRLQPNPFQKTSTGFQQSTIHPMQPMLSCGQHAPQRLELNPAQHCAYLPQQSNIHSMQQRLPSGTSGQQPTVQYPAHSKYE